MVGFGLDYACAHIIIPASVNLLPIQANFVTERVILLHWSFDMIHYAEVNVIPDHCLYILCMPTLSYGEQAILVFGIGNFS